MDFAGPGIQCDASQETRATIPGTILTSIPESLVDIGSLRAFCRRMP